MLFLLLLVLALPVFGDSVPLGELSRTNRVFTGDSITFKAGPRIDSAGVTVGGNTFSWPTLPAWAEGGTLPPASLAVDIFCLGLTGLQYVDSDWALSLGEWNAGPGAEFFNLSREGFRLQTGGQDKAHLGGDSLTFSPADGVTGGGQPVSYSRRGVSVGSAEIAFPPGSGLAPSGEVFATRREVDRRKAFYWDEDEEVLWAIRVRNGYLEVVAETNRPLAEL